MSLHLATVRPTAALLSSALLLAACARPTVIEPAVYAASAPMVGPARGAVMVVGGGAIGPELYSKFIELAGGPDALIVDVPTAGSDSAYPPDWQGARAFRLAGARNVVVLHTMNRAVADADSFVAVLEHAGGVWFDGGRQWRLVDSYAGTKAEAAFHEVLARGGVVGGSSAGASILSSYLIRGAREGNTIVMDPAYEHGFGFLRGVAIDQHAVARERLADLADSLMPRRPDLLGISEDEGTAWLVRGDVGEVIGRNKAFVYGGKDPTDPGTPFLTLHPGDRYDLGARRLLSRAIDGLSITAAFVDSLVNTLIRGGAGRVSVLVAQEGRVLVDRSYGVPPQPKYMPTTTVPNFPLGGLSDGFNSIAAQLVAVEGKLSLDDPLVEGGATVRQYLSHEHEVQDGSSLLAELLARRVGTTYAQLISRRIYAPIGAHRTSTGADGQFQSNVDELYRLALGMESSARTFARDTSGTILSSQELPFDQTLGWRADFYHGADRLALYGTANGKQNAFIRIPSRRLTVIILTDDERADVASVADGIIDRLWPH